MKRAKWISTGMAFLLILIDQCTKQWAIRTLSDGTRIQVIPNLFYLSYVENRGAAFGIMQGNTNLLSLITGVLMLGALVLVYSGKLQSVPLTYTVMLILSGGLGNLIDRLSRGFVVDYLDFSALFNFPVFNFADCCVVVGTLLLLILVLRMDAERQGTAAPREPGEDS
ncbi:signal peptidase II [Ruminococcaceae bacterium OttesenSCG-928-L11]|nr:signal peptidase II [Ruminococcaceae bacterium OttesenSCG-928-L11]